VLATFACKDANQTPIHNATASEALFIKCDMSSHRKGVRIQGIMKERVKKSKE
jgi:hypothetical protein